MSSSALKAARPIGAGAQLGASSPGLALDARAVAEILAITTQDDFLLELGAVLGAQVAVHPVESLTLALEQMGASRRAQILVFDTRGMADLRNSVGRAYARAPDAVILLFAHAADEEGIRRAFKGSKIFAVLPIPLDSPRTALALAQGLTDAIAKDRPAPARTAAARSMPATSSKPRNDRWGLGAALAVLILASAWFIARNKEPAAPSAERPALGVAAGQASPLSGRVDGAHATAVKVAGASQTDAADARVASSTPGAADHPSAPQPHLELMNYVEPQYPAAALARHVGGTVVVAYTVDMQGVTHDVRVVSAEPAGIFNSNAIDAVKRWRYAPLTVHNAALAVPTRTAIHFPPH